MEGITNGSHYIDAFDAIDFHSLNYLEQEGGASHRLAWLV
jgi:hypothetical protein